jgi:hypothetical protein
VDHFDLYAKVRASNPETDPVKRWAELEGKSATMRDELYRRHVSTRRTQLKLSALILPGSKLIAAVLQSWFGNSR